MKRELIEAMPIRLALQEITDKEVAQADDTARQAFAEARAIVDAAIAVASNPQFGDGIELAEYANLKGIKPDTLRKQIRRGKREAEKRGGRYFIRVDSAA